MLAAHSPDLDRRAAIKLLDRSEPEPQARLVLEARATARLGGRYIAQAGTAY